MRKQTIFPVEPLYVSGNLESGLTIGARGLAGKGNANQLVGWDVNVSGFEYKDVLAGKGVLVKHDPNKITLSVDTSVVELAIAAGSSGQYWRYDKTWAALNQAAVAGLTISDTPRFNGLGIGTAANPTVAILAKSPASGYALYSTKSDGSSIIFYLSESEALLGADIPLNLSGGNTGIQKISFNQPDGFIALKVPANLLSSQTITFPELTGFVTLNAAALTNGSIPFVSSGLITQNNSNLFWDDTNKIVKTKMIYLDNTSGYIDRRSQLTLSRTGNSAPPSGIDSTLYILTDSMGDGSSYLGYAGIYVKTFQRAGQPRGSMVGITISVAPSTENNPYTANLDATNLVLDNQGSVIGTEPLYIGEAGSPGVTPTAFNPEGYSFHNGIKTEDKLGTHISLSGSANIGVDTTGLTFVGVSPRPFKASSGTTSQFGNIYAIDSIGVGVSSPLASVHVQKAASVELRVEATTNNSAADINLYGKTSGGAVVRARFLSSNGGEVDIGAISNHQLALLTNNTERVLIGNTGAIKITSGVPSSLIYLNSGNVLAYASATNGQLLIGSTGANPVAATITGTSNRLSVANGAGSITLDIDASYVGQSSIATLGTITTGTWNGSIIGLAYGGSNANLTASNGGMVYSTGSALAILAGTAIAGLALVSGASTTPSWFAPTAGSVLFAGTGGILQQDNSNLFWDNTNKRLGIGTSAPIDVFHIVAESLKQEFLDMYSNTASSRHIWYFRRAGGTLASPATVGGNYNLGEFRFYAHNGTSFIEGTRITTVTSNTGTISSTSMPTLFSIAVTPDGSNSLVTRYAIDKDGNTVLNGSGKNVGIGASSWGTSADKVLGIFNGTEPTTSPIDMIQIYSVDLSAGNATLGLRTETAVVTETVTSDRTLSVRINGTTYKICLKS